MNSPTLATFDLLPCKGLSSDVARRHEWCTNEHVARFEAETSLDAGWYRLRLRIATPDRPAVRKRAELFADCGDGFLKREQFEWNRELEEDLTIQLPERACRLQLTLRHCNPTFAIERFEIRRTSRTRTVARALRLKFQLLRSYNCVWPVVTRGGKLLAEGRLQEFGRKLLRGIPDSRTMRIEVKRAEEVAAMWWRRRAISADRIVELKSIADDIANPDPIAILLPVDPTRSDHARQAILSVFRQVYPHWELFVLSTAATVSPIVTSVAAWDSRTEIVLPTDGDGLRSSLEIALNRVHSRRVIVLPPDWEMSEDALLRFAQTESNSVVCESSNVGTDSAYRPSMMPVSVLKSSISKLHSPTVHGFTRWSSEQNTEPSTRLSEPLIFPLDGSRSLSTRIAPTVRSESCSLVLGADIRGISGWDHVAFAIAKGLSSSGVHLEHHAASKIYSELLPPQLQFRTVKRSPSRPQLAMSPPFLLDRFGIDARSAVLTMWETDRLDAKDVAVLNRARLVIVPSRWGADCFRASGVRVPIEVVPLGYDPLVFSPGAEQPSLCTFGTAGALSQGGLRKNVRRVIELFQAAFPTRDDVRLRVKITPDCPPFEVEHDRRIEILRAALPYADLATWNRSLAAYVNASFAEGFGFHLLEAMACGVPLISTHYSGLTEFFDDRVGYVVPHRLIEAKNAIYSGKWADPDDDAMIEAMRRVYHNREEAKQFAERSAVRARQFTWRDSGRKLRDALDRHGFFEPSSKPGNNESDPQPISPSPPLRGRGPG